MDVGLPLEAGESCVCFARVRCGCALCPGGEKSRGSRLGGSVTALWGEEMLKCSRS